MGIPVKLRGEHYYWESLKALIDAQGVGKDDKDYMYKQCQLLAFSLYKQTEFLAISLEEVLNEVKALRNEIRGAKR